MKENIIILCKGNISSIPPVTNSILSLLKLGYEIKIICGDIDIMTEKYLLTIDKNLNIKKIKSLTSKIFTWCNFHIQAWKIIKKSKFDYLWIATGDTALCLGWKLNNYKFILNILELYDSAPIYKILLGKISKSAYRIIVPEFNRACIFRVYWKLDRTPNVIPNKPFVIDFKESEMAKIVIEDIERKKGERLVVLYQGLITPYRNLNMISKVLHTHKDKFLFVLMGPDFGYLEELKKYNNNLLYYETLPSPLHLNVTKHCDIGIVVYDYIDLNNIYCAPNKIWEYSKFGKPMLGNDIPGLKYTIEYYGAGLCVNNNNEYELIDALLHIKDNYKEYAMASKKFNESVDIVDCHKIIFE